ncbi:biotin carboxylase N-terminal domain-containing protein [Psychrobacillus sp. BL-248-WT-3]|uniref:acetyl-CoA carboxylase biotin carboxylase subunit n=1 Tax=Psychrobacillus sp. BL-248-WT-3 TaxID=2725306 RepID=UPI00146D0E55|nr:biotin carboxylase N-terminal domain-containing protein [Psychrobacillus sp. BL-248-WT-3]NME05225.1 ATP-grasp domain-containing protein [Psychrobacillus sp. BL-248-WT-3]
MKKLLIANRGEIARRIIKTCKRLNIETVAIYSEADEQLPYVKEADYAFLIGPSQVQQSYLKADDIIELAIREGVDAIHPGYGFLSENAEFARKAEAAGITFIGPKAETIEKMGDKIESRITMIHANVPVVPGTEDGLNSLDEALQAAKQIGYPIMLKASAGGGGIGMIKCDDEATLTKHFESIKTRAKSYFGSDIVFLEKFIEDSRHIEVQIFGDTKGNIVHLFERNCSVQRRNQKVLEESPSPNFPEEAKKKLFEAAVNAAKAVDYVNAGTVEFIVDQNHQFYFLEMNTRLQVEHPVTEAVTGFDLVEWQLKVAQGEELPVKEQDKITTNGHAFEFRIYAEDPKTFFPSPGTISTLTWGNDSDVRIDAGYEEGNKVTPFYDPMISKVIIHAENRRLAIEKAQKLFSSAKIEGVRTNISLFDQFLHDSTFESGVYSTSVLGEWMDKQREEISK